MNTNPELEKIIQRIKKLKAHAESAKEIGSIEEAALFAAKMEELMVEYNITMMQVDHAKEFTKDEFAHWQYTEGISYKDSQANFGWRLNLVRVICKYNFCSHVINSGKKQFFVYGHADNVDTVVWLYNYLSIGLMRLAQSEWNRIGKSTGYSSRVVFLKEFLYGAGYGIDSKLEEQRKANQKMNEYSSLILYNKNALVRYIGNKFGSQLGKGRAYGIKPKGHAFKDGYAAGKNYNLGKPVGGSTNNQKQIR